MFHEDKKLRSEFIQIFIYNIPFGIYFNTNTSSQMAVQTASGSEAPVLMLRELSTISL